MYILDFLYVYFRFLYVYFRFFCVYFRYFSVHILDFCVHILDFLCVLILDFWQAHLDPLACQSVCVSLLNT
jgi:hypothetical protein